MDVSSWLRKQFEEASPDLLRVMVKDFAEALMSADADAVCGTGYGERSSQRVNRRNGYRERDWDTRVGSIELAVPRLREGSYFPDWLLQPRRLPRVARPRRRYRRGRRRLARVRPRPGRARPRWREAGQLGRAPRPRRRDRRHAPGCGLATMPHPLHAQPAHPRAQEHAVV